MPEIPKDTENPSGLSKWELALYIGVPVTALCAAGLAYLYLVRNEESSEEVKEDVESSQADDVKVADAKSEADTAAAVEKVSKPNENMLSPSARLYTMAVEPLEIILENSSTLLHT